VQTGATEELVAPHDRVRILPAHPGLHLMDLAEGQPVPFLKKVTGAINLSQLALSEEVDAFMAKQLDAFDILFRRLNRKCAALPALRAFESLM